MGNKCHQEAGSTCKIYTILFLVKNHKLMILIVPKYMCINPFGESIYWQLFSTALWMCSLHILKLWCYQDPWCYLYKRSPSHLWRYLMSIIKTSRTLCLIAWQPHHDLFLVYSWWDINHVMMMMIHFTCNADLLTSSAKFILTAWFASFQQICCVISSVAFIKNLCFHHHVILYCTNIACGIPQKI